MDKTYITEPVIFLLDTLASLYIIAIILRFLLQWMGAEFYNPIAQMLIRITHPPLKWLRRYIPAVGRIDTASLILAFALQMSVDFTTLLLRDVDVSFSALLVLSFSQLLSLLINVLIFAVFARAILSWVNPGTYHAAASILYSLTEPLLRFCRGALPTVAGGIDLSPLIVLIVLQLMKMLLLPPLQQLTALLG
jgi:YggT family protein